MQDRVYGEHVTKSESPKLDSRLSEFMYEVPGWKLWGMGDILRAVANLFEPWMRTKLLETPVVTSGHSRITIYDVIRARHLLGLPNW